MRDKVGEDHLGTLLGHSSKDKWVRAARESKGCGVTD